MSPPPPSPMSHCHTSSVLQDFMRQAGEVTYADAHKERTNEGVIEFRSHSDMKRALDKLDGTDINGRKIRLVEDRPRRRRSYSGSRSRWEHTMLRPPKKPCIAIFQEKNGYRPVCNFVNVLSLDPVAAAGPAAGAAGVLGVALGPTPGESWNYQALYWGWCPLLVQFMLNKQHCAMYTKAFYVFLTGLVLIATRDAIIPVQDLEGSLERVNPVPVIADPVLSPANQSLAPVLVNPPPVLLSASPAPRVVQR